VRSKHVCLVFDSEGTFDIRWVGARHDTDVDVLRRSSLASCPESVSIVLVVHSTRSAVSSWQALRELERRYPGVPTFITAPTPNGDWLIVSAHVDQIGPLPEPATLCALVGGHGDIEMIGASPAIERTRAVIGRVAATDTNVLITGESGTGKELVAEMVHRASARSRGRFVPVNCAAVPDSLFESELFGHQRGAFTGAVTSREGRFGEAHDGTLFLDEIGELSQYAQAKILRAVETGRIDRLGARGGTEVNVRCVAATNRNLEEMVASGTFRQDLYFRLNVVEIELPPLRERSEDIPVLLDYYIPQLNKRFGTVVERVDEGLVELLSSYTWPGNIRELRNLLESIYALRPQPVITTADLPDVFRRRLRLHRTDDEKQRLLATLRATNWNKSAAAKELQWSRVTLYRKLTKYDLAAPQKATMKKASLKKGGGSLQVG
jgi:DNA-binding NtrC family response regulator